MTIAISVKVNDGVVLAADSASTLMQIDEQNKQQLVVNVYESAEKVFNLFKGLPLGVATWGSGGIGKESISTLAKDFRKKMSESSEIDKLRYTVKEIADKFKEFFWEKYKTTYGDLKNAPEIGFIITGYSSNEPLAEEYIIEFKNGDCQGPNLIRPKEDSGAAWFGQPEAIFRLIKGYSTLLPDLLNKMGVSEKDIGIIMEECQKYIEATHIHDAMPIQDAIDLAKFLVEVTIGFVRFNPGAKTVGGPIDIAVITKHEGFKWVKRKHYYQKEFNP